MAHLYVSVAELPVCGISHPDKLPINCGGCGAQRSCLSFHINCRGRGTGPSFQRPAPLPGSCRQPGRRQSQSGGLSGLARSATTAPASIMRCSRHLSTRRRHQCSRSECCPALRCDLHPSMAPQKVWLCRHVKVGQEADQRQGQAEAGRAALYVRVRPGWQHCQCARAELFHPQLPCAYAR